MSNSRQPLIVGDIGGTHARFAVVPPGPTPRLEGVRVLNCRDFPDLATATLAYLADLEIAGDLCLALPGPVELPIVPLVNNPWRQVDPLELREALSVEISLLNDFTAQAHALPYLQGDELHWLRGEAASKGARVVVGPGTGLGVGPLSAAGEVLESEAGQMHFAPATTRQRELLARLGEQRARVVNETLVSGPGLINLHRALHDLFDDAAELRAEDISERARRGDERCLETLSEFSVIFGAMCGDFALGFGSSGGVYLSGGLLEAIEDLMDWPAFLSAFDDKGAYRSFCERVPVALVRHPWPGLLGAAAFALQQRIP